MLYVSALAAGTNNYQTTSEHINALATDFVPVGVVGVPTNTSGTAPTTGSFGVNAQGTPDNTIAVSAGTAYVQATPTGQLSQVLRVRNTASINATISANATGGTRYDWVYISISASLAANPLIDASTTASIVVSRSTSSTVDNGTPPSFGLAIAVVTVANGFSTITSGNIADKRVQSVVASPRITGEVVPYAGSTAPAGWLIADGTAVSRGTYSALYALIGTTYGSGDGSTTFNLPNLKGRTVLGVGLSTATGATTHTLGQSGGEETHTLTTTEMPSHAHNHSVDLGPSAGWASGTPQSGTDGGTGRVGGTWSDRSGSPASGLVRANGSGAAHNILPPYVSLNYIIKV